MNFPNELRYTKTHEWARRDGNVLTVGITDYAQKEISDVVFVELPKSGKEGQAGKPIAVVESVKAAFDIYAPVSGSVTQVNSALEGDPGLVNQDCYGKGWFFSIALKDASEWDKLMTKEDYEKSLKTGV
ncbi:MAG TPA: glycine cleavage system protein GcvH [Verrucomicrobiae bacterium]|jgi:glycine cleavage system H protein|nr:glycine cleavage system protein GcvH [Verrucomicrobiae bacterium]